MYIKIPFCILKAKNTHSENTGWEVGIFPAIILTNHISWSSTVVVYHENGNDYDISDYRDYRDYI